MVILDLSEQQLALTDLRIQTLKQFDYPDFLKLFGYEEATTKIRRRLFAQLTLDERTRARMQSHLESHEDLPLIYTGRWEQTMLKLHKVVKTLFSAREINQMFDCKTDKEWSTYYFRSFPHFRWAALVRLLANTQTLNTLLYRGSHPRLNMASSNYEYFAPRFKEMFRAGPPRKNPFFQLIFLGKLQYPEGFPSEVESETSYLEQKRGALNSDITLKRQNIHEYLATHPSITFASLSDIFSYLTPEAANEVSSLLASNASHSSVIRYYLYRPIELTTGQLIRQSDKMNFYEILQLGPNLSHASS